jgi:hypothetical protein
MSDERAQTGEKEYWHDKRLVPAHTAPRPAKLSADCSVDAAATPPPPRALRNLRHPIATFVVIVLAIILLSVGLLAATGGAALPVLPVRLADCAKPTASTLGAPGAQFTAAFPAGVRAPFSSPAVNDYCTYGSSEADGDSARPLDFLVTATSGEPHVNGWTGLLGTEPYWVVPSKLQHVSFDGASGLEAFRCDETTDWCFGWLKVSRGHVIWVVSGTGNGARLLTIKAFMGSFHPAP